MMVKDCEMKNNLRMYIILENATIREALIRIDENKKGFLIVVNNDAEVQGTLTDGDIRRAFLKDYSMDDSISDIFTKKFKYVDVEGSMGDAVEMFKNNSIKFLPVVDDKKRIVNLVTKRQVHSLMLQDIRADLKYSFEQIDENLVDYEIYLRPWGFYKTTVLNEYFQAKIISVEPNKKLSLQSHNCREEYWIVVHGYGQVQIGDSIKNVECGSSLFIPKGCKHRLINLSKSESLIISEIQIGSYLGEDDIIRYEDEYGRV